jgi:hypothetical protein
MASKTVGVSVLDLALSKVQADNQTAATLLAPATDQLAAASGFKIEHENVMNEASYAAGTYGQHKAIKGFRAGTVAFDMYARPSGAVTLSDIVPIMKNCGFINTIDTNKSTLTPSTDESAWFWRTFWKYTGNLASTGDSLLTKVEGVLLDCVISWVVGEPIKFSFSGRGAAGIDIVAATYPTGATQPTTCGLAFVSGKVSVLGQTNTLQEFKLTIGNAIELVKDPTKNGGYRNASSKDRKTKWEATVLQEDVSASNPFALLDAGTLSTISVSVGLTGATLEFLTTSKAQVLNVSDSDVNGLKSFKIDGLIIDNDYSIVFNGTDV